MTDRYSTTFSSMDYMTTFSFNSRRSPVYGKGGMVASSQPLATAAGLEILAKGGNAADAATAAGAALNVTEPTSTGIGGDVFALQKMGHLLYAVTGYERALFGRGQVILRDAETGVLCAGSDPRADGCAMTL